MGKNRKIRKLYFFLGNNLFFLLKGTALSQIYISTDKYLVLLWNQKCSSYYSRIVSILSQFLNSKEQFAAKHMRALPSSPSVSPENQKY